MPVSAKTQSSLCCSMWVEGLWKSRLELGTPPAGDVETRGQFKALSVQSEHHPLDAYVCYGCRKAAVSQLLVHPECDWAVKVWGGLIFGISSPSPFCSCSVAKSYPILCDPMDCSMPGFPVLHHLPEFVQVHVHWVGDAIQPSHPMLSPSPPTFNLLSIRVFSNESAVCIKCPKYWSFSISPSKEYSGLISSKSLISLLSKGFSRVFSSTTVR